MLASKEALVSSVVVLLVLCCHRGGIFANDCGGGCCSTIHATAFCMNRGPNHRTCAAPVATSIGVTSTPPRGRRLRCGVSITRRKSRGGIIFARGIPTWRGGRGCATIAAWDEGGCDDSGDGDNRRHDEALLAAIARPPPPRSDREVEVEGDDDDDAMRIFHGRGGTFPGCEDLTFDWFPPVFVLTSFHQEVPEEDLRRYHDALSERWSLMQHRRRRGNADDDDDANCDVGPVVNWVYQCRLGHASSSTSTMTMVMSGTVPDPHVVTERGNRYLVHVGGGNGGRRGRRDRGLFLDMSDGRSWVRRNSHGRKVLNLFAHTCSFSIAAASGGAAEVVNVDMNRGALRIGQRNHELNNSLDCSGATATPSSSDCKVRFLGHDVFKSWGKLRRLGPYGIVVVDPPSHQGGSFVAKRDYVKVIRRMPELLVPGGHAMLCLNAPELDAEFLSGLVAEEAPELRFVERLDNPPSFPVADVERGLKVLIYQMPI